MSEVVIPAITIRQPWAYLVVAGFKPIENRKWPSKHRGPLAIHAGKNCTRDEHEAAVDFIVARGLASIVPPFDRLVRGAVIGVVDMVDCVASHPSGWYVGPFGHVYQRAQEVKPVPCAGALGLWRMPPDVERQVRAQLGGAS